MIDFNIDETGMIPGLEAINFQVSSSFAKKLTAVFQDVINYRDELDYSGVAKDASHQQKYRQEMVAAYWKKTGSENFKRVVREESGVIISKIHNHYGYPMGLFAVDLSFNNWQVAVETIERETGLGNDIYTADRAAVEEMKDMTNSLDTSTGKLKTPYFGKKRKISAEMYFDVTTAFLIQDYVPKTIEPFTAEELAAIMMHETGHVLTVVEHASDLYMTKRRIDTWAKNLKTSQDLSGTLKELTTNLVPMLKKLAKRSDINKDSAGMLTRLCNTCAQALETLNGAYNSPAQPAESGFFETILDTMGHFIAIALYLVLAVVGNIIVLVFLIPWIIELTRYAYVDVTSSGTKAGDTPSNYNNTFLLERWADEFVSRHGYGPQIASGLNKFDEIFKYLNAMATVKNTRLQNSTLFACLATVAAWFMDKISIAAYLDPVGYENNYQRLYRVLQNTYTAFRDTEMSGETLDMWYFKIEELKKQVKKAKTISDTPLAKASYNVLKTLTNPVRWYELVKNGNMDRDMEILENNLDDISSNALHFLAASLKR